ncbi:MAG: hypothetical protein ACYS67_16500 [Planctomycetota bacterium]
MHHRLGDGVGLANTHRREVVRWNAEYWRMAEAKLLRRQFRCGSAS